MKRVGNTLTIGKIKGLFNSVEMAGAILAIQAGSFCSISPWSAFYTISL
jgi:hypothetical protein